MSRLFSRAHQLLLDVTTGFNFNPTREGWFGIWLRQVFRPVNLTDFNFFTPSSLWKMTRKQHRQKFLTPLTRLRKQNSHPFVVWNSAVSALLSGPSRFLLSTDNHAKRGWSVSPVPTGMAMRQSERTFFFRNIYCPLQWHSSKHGNLLKTVAKLRSRTMLKDANATVKDFRWLSGACSSQREWSENQSISERLPSQPFRNQTYPLWQEAGQLRRVSSLDVPGILTG
ncbi:hypothetical protein Pan241w_04070 [Gimesia alba]|uniref:Uncharacterized protein n=1 Tax=Gimesia alba TaxID=2527973 RepID=A0A517R921_9PLAN|nr:hypothetical protein Pan241w_04070 [Gimesia alba]